MSIREATKSDIKAIIRIVSSLSRYYLKDKDAALPLWFSKTLHEHEFENRVIGNDYSNFVYEVNGSIVGYISLKGQTHLFHLFVLSEYQGKGIARMLWEHVKLVSGSQVYTLRSSLYAVPIYKTFGFCVSGDMQEKEGICYQPMVLRAERL